MQLDLISTSTLGVLIETSFVSPLETEQVQKVNLNWTGFFIHTRTERYDIVSFHFLVHFSVPPQFLDLFWNGPLDFFRNRVNATPLRTIFWNGPKWNGMISYPCEQGFCFKNWALNKLCYFSYYILFPS